MEGTEYKTLTLEKLISYMEYKLEDTENSLDYENSRGEDADLEYIEGLLWEIDDTKSMLQELVNANTVNNLIHTI